MVIFQKRTATCRYYGLKAQKIQMSDGRANVERIVYLLREMDRKTLQGV